MVCAPHEIQCGRAQIEDLASLGIIGLCVRFVAGHLPFEPHSDSVIQLPANQVCEKILSPMYPLSDHEGYRCLKGLAKKLLCCLFVTEIVFKTKLYSHMVE